MTASATPEHPHCHAATPPAVRLLPAGDRTLLVELGEHIDAGTNARVLALAHALRAPALARQGLLGVVPAYRSVSVGYDPLRLPFERLCRLVREALEASHGAPLPPARRWRVPVCYGGAHGEDLAALAATHGLAPEAVVARHSAVEYRVYMVGFLPGFAYLGGLDARLHTPRRATPRAHTPAGSISIGGQQTAVASVAGPSGWHLIGRTPWRGFDPRRRAPFLFTAGDVVAFQPVDAAEFERLDAHFAQPGHVPLPETGPPAEAAA